MPKTEFVKDLNLGYLAKRINYESETEREWLMGSLKALKLETNVENDPIRLVRRKLEADLDMPFKQIPLSYLMKHEATIEPALIEQKVYDQVIRGAELVDLSRNMSRVVSMPSPKYEVSLINYTNFEVVKGALSAQPRNAGGIFDRVELDCSQQNGVRRIRIAMDKTWIRDNNWNAMSEAFAAAGYSMALAMMKDICGKYVSDVDSAMTNTMANWGNNSWKCMLKGLGLVAGQQMYPTMCIVPTDCIYSLGVNDYFVNALYTAAAAKLDLKPSSGLLGSLLPNTAIPIYWTYAATSGDIIVAAAEKAMILGIRQDYTIEDFNDVIRGEEGGVLWAQWDTKSGKDAILDKPTAKSWALATSVT